MQLYLDVVDNRIRDIKYPCSCEPTANVAVEMLCSLAKGKGLDEAVALSEKTFYQLIGCEGDELKLKVRGLLEMLKEGIAGYKAQMLTSKEIAQSPQWQISRDFGLDTAQPYVSINKMNRMNRRKTVTIRCEHASPDIRLRISEENIFAIQCGLIQIFPSRAQAARVRRHCACMLSMMEDDREHSPRRSTMTIDPTQLDLGGHYIGLWRIG